MKLRIIQDEEKATVPMAPLIDCVFILLIFFLVTSMLQKPHMELDLYAPHSGAGEIDAKQPEPLVIMMLSALPQGLVAERQEIARLMRKDPVPKEQRFEPFLLIGEEVLNKELLERRLRHIAQKTPTRCIRLDVEEHIAWRHVVPILDICRFHGLTRVDVRTR